MTGRMIAFDIGLVMVSCWAGTVGFAQWVEDDVRKEKREYLLKYDADFMRHFDVLWAKYNLDDHVQTQGILSNE